MYIGPFSDPTNFHQVMCEGCEQFKYYRISVDTAFVDGYADRFWGFLLAENEDFSVFFGISPFQAALVTKWDYSVGDWVDLISQGQMWKSIINPSYGTNHLEVFVEPAGSGTGVDYTIKINGKNAYVITSQPVKTSQVGFAIGWQAMGVWYDNFEFEEIEVK